MIYYQNIYNALEHLFTWTKYSKLLDERIINLYSGIHNKPIESRCKVTTLQVGIESNINVVIIEKNLIGKPYDVMYLDNAIYFIIFKDYIFQRDNMNIIFSRMCITTEFLCKLFFKKVLDVKEFTDSTMYKMNIVMTLPIVMKLFQNNVSDFGIDDIKEFKEIAITIAGPDNSLDVIEMLDICMNEDLKDIFDYGKMVKYLYILESL